jgi:hypothetical protein
MAIKHFSRPGDRSLHAYKEWIRGMVAALDGMDDIATEEEWIAHWKGFWGDVERNNGSAE